MSDDEAEQQLADSIEQQLGAENGTEHPSATKKKSTVKKHPAPVASDEEGDAEGAAKSSAPSASGSKRKAPPTKAKAHPYHSDADESEILRLRKAGEKELAGRTLAPVEATDADYFERSRIVLSKSDELPDDFKIIKNPASDKASVERRARVAASGFQDEVVTESGGASEAGVNREVTGLLNKDFAVALDSRLYVRFVLRADEFPSSLTTAQRAALDKAGPDAVFYFEPKPTVFEKMCTFTSRMYNWPAKELDPMFRWSVPDSLIAHKKRTSANKSASSSSKKVKKDQTAGEDQADVSEQITPPKSKASASSSDKKRLAQDESNNGTAKTSSDKRRQLEDSAKAAAELATKEIEGTIESYSKKQMESYAAASKKLEEDRQKLTEKSKAIVEYARKSKPSPKEGEFPVDKTGIAAMVKAIYLAEDPATGSKRRTFALSRLRESLSSSEPAYALVRDLLSPEGSWAEFVRNNDIIKYMQTVALAKNETVGRLLIVPIMCATAEVLGADFQSKYESIHREFVSESNHLEASIKALTEKAKDIDARGKAEIERVMKNCEKTIMENDENWKVVAQENEKLKKDLQSAQNKLKALESAKVAASPAKQVASAKQVPTKKQVTREEVASDGDDDELSPAPPPPSKKTAVSSASASKLKPKPAPVPVEEDNEDFS